MSSEYESIIRQTIEHLICPSEGSIRIATKDDAETLFHFINKAYKENHVTYTRKGFENRLNGIEEIHNFMENGIFLLLTASTHEQMTILQDEYAIVACVFINHLDTDKSTAQTIDTKSSITINALSVHPKMVRRGIARYMMQVVEVIAKKFRYTHMCLNVLSIHQHVLDMYIKWNFKMIGIKTLADYDINPEIYTRPCHFIRLEKQLL